MTYDWTLSPKDLKEYKKYYKKPSHSPSISIDLSAEFSRSKGADIL
jgi:hypothetical protein